MFRFYSFKFKDSNRSISRHVRGPRDRELGGEEDPEQLQAVQAPEGAGGRGEEEEQQGQSGHGGGGGGGGHHGGGRGGGGDGGGGGAAAAAELQEGVVVVAAIVPSKKLKIVGWGAANCRQMCRHKLKGVGQGAVNCREKCRHFIRKYMFLVPRFCFLQNRQGEDFFMMIHSVLCRGGPTEDEKKLNSIPFVLDFCVRCVCRPPL